MMHYTLEERLGIRIARGGEGSSGGSSSSAADSRWGRVGAAVGALAGGRFGGKTGAAVGGLAGFEAGSFMEGAFNNRDAQWDGANAMDGWPGGSPGYSGSANGGHK